MRVLDGTIAALGTIVMILAYWPQIWHLLKEKCAAGISLRAYVLWSLAALLLFLHAIFIQDKVFILLQGLNLLATWAVTIITLQYPKGRCPLHVGEV